MIKIDTSIKDLKEVLTKVRRDLHRIPEPGLKEYETTEYISKYLEDLGIQIETGVMNTGVVGFIKGLSDETIAFRADIDALSVEEQTNVDYCSTKTGYMHACGHDGHMAVLLGLARLLSQKKAELNKNILLIFQPAEEGPGGAEPIVESGLLESYNVKYIFGLHIFPDIEEGKIGCRPGAMMAQTGEFDIRINGKGAHGAMPHKGTDALLAAAGLVSALNTVVSRNTDPIEPAVLNIGRMISGERRNIIAEEALLEGTMRAFSEETYGIVRRRMIEAAESISKAYNCSVDYEIRDMYPAVTNDEGLYNMLRDMIDNEDFVILKPQTISEDFSYYQKRVPGLFFMLGSRNEKEGYVYSLHNNRFNFNEAILLTGVQMMYNIYRKLNE
ncbi:MAG: M20 metallopeptidase family protein [Bacillota bacterium]